MSRVIRVLQADCDRSFKDKLGEFLAGREGLCYLGAIDNGTNILEAIADTRPHVLLLSLNLRPNGGLRILRNIREHWNEEELAVLIVSPPDAGEEALQEAADLGADYYIQRPVDLFVLARRIIQVCSENLVYSLPDLSRQQVEEICRGYFDNMGIPPHYKGYRYLMEGVWIAFLYPRWLNAMTKKLYPAIGQRFDTGGAQVERAMRYALDVTWEKGDLSELYRLFPYEVREDRGKPTNSAFIAKMVNFVILENGAGG